MSTATLNGHTAMLARVTLPAWGLPWFDVTLDQEVTLAGKCTLVVADATYVCAVVSGGTWLGRSAYRLVGGAGGWSRTLPRRSYASDAGVKLSRIVGDAAREAGETIDGAPSGVAGPAFDRFEGLASDVLQLVAPGAWRVEADGVTRFGKPPVGTLDVVAARGRVDRAAGFVELKADAIAGITPGVVVEDVTAVDVVHTIESGKLRTVIWGSTSGVSKRLAAHRALVLAMFPALRYGGVWEYRVVRVIGGRLDLQPARASLPVPDLRAVKMRPGLPGCKGEPKMGSLVHVEFVNADPARPVATAFDDSESAGFGADRLDLSAGDELLVADTTGRVVRYGDTFFAPLGTTGAPTPYRISSSGLVPGGPPSPAMPASRVRA